MFNELIKEALTTLKSNLLRTILTTIGIILGVGAVVSIMTMGKSAYAALEQMIMDSGIGNVTIRQNYGKSNPPPLNAALVRNLTAQKIDGVALIEPVFSGGCELMEDETTEFFYFCHNYKSAASVAKERLVAGNYFTQQDVDAASSVTIIDVKAAEHFFGSSERAIGETLNVDGRSYRVVGVYLAMMGGFDQNYGDAWLPISLGEQSTSYESYGYSNLAITAGVDADYEAVSKNVENALMEIYGYETVEELPFEVSSIRGEMAQVSGVMTVFSIGLSLIAAISLVVGGVGIMNIMLVSVTERTKEIGLMKALGARDGDIIFQFLVESVVLTVLGGLIGVVAGLTLSAVAILVVNQFGPSLSLPTFKLVMDFNSIIVSVVVAIVIGLVSGIYPARKAAKLDPVEALRRD